jgi:electron transport complex protein RnfG
MKKMIKPTVVLLAFTLVSAALIGLTYTVTAGPLAQQRAQMAAGPLLELMPATHRTADVYLEEHDSSLTHLVRCYDAGGQFIGYVFTAAPRGFVAEIETMVAINPQGVIEAVQIVNHEETRGIGSIIDEDWFTEQFAGRSGMLFGTAGATGPQEVDIIAGATISMDAVISGVNDAMAYFGGVDAPADTAQAPQAAYAPAIDELWPGTYRARHISMAISFDAEGEVNGYVFYVSPQGYNPIEMAVAIDTQGLVQGIQILSHSETWTFGGWLLEDDDFLQQFVGRSETLTAVSRADGPQEIDAVSMATLTVDGVLQGINDSIEYFNSLQRQ